MESQILKKRLTLNRRKTELPIQIKQQRGPNSDEETLIGLKQNKTPVYVYVWRVPGRAKPPLPPCGGGFVRADPGPRAHETPLLAMAQHKEVNDPISSTMSFFPKIMRNL